MFQKKGHVPGFCLGWEFLGQRLGLKLYNPPLRGCKKNYWMYWQWYRWNNDRSDPHRTFGLPLDPFPARKSQFLDMFTCNGFW